MKAIVALTFAAVALAQERHMIPGPFNAVAYDGMMSCVNTVSDRYDVAIDHGVVFIIPPAGQHIAIDSDADNALWNCLERFSHYVHLAVDFGRSAVDDDGAVTTTLALATAQWAESHGAEGMTLQPVENHRRDLSKLPGASTLLPRAAPLYFVSYGDQD